MKMLCEQISQFFLNITTYSEYTLSKQHIFNTNLTHGTTKLYTCDVNWLHVFFLEMNRFFSKRQTTVKGSTQPTYKLQHICDQRNNNIRQNANCNAKNTPQSNKSNHEENKQNLFFVPFEFKCSDFEGKHRDMGNHQQRQNKNKS